MKQLDILGKLFGSTVRVKLMKLFLLNQDEAFAIVDLADRFRVKPKALKEELSTLSRAGFIRAKAVVKTTTKKRTVAKKKVPGFVANKDFALAEALRGLVIDSGGTHVADLPARFGKVGKVTLLIASGIFLRDPDRSMDLLLVGDRLDKKLLERKIRELESEVGRELRYAVFETPEFLYRLKMYDKLLRDVLDYPHEKVISKIDHPELRR